MKPSIWMFNLLVVATGLFLCKSASAQAVDDYRTRASGNWNAVATWQRYDGTTWVNVNGVAPNTIPTSADKVITIQNTFTVTVTANTTIDQTTIEAGGSLIVNAGRTLTIADGTGTDLIINGSVINDGTITTTGTVGFGAGSSYDHIRNGGTIPTASWNVGATCTVSGITGSAPGGLDQDFGNFNWNCTSQTSNINLGGDLKTINGNFTVASTGSGNDVLRLTNATDLTMNIAGNFILSGGDMLFTDNKADVTVNVVGNFTQSAGSLDLSDNNQIGILIFNVSGNFSQTGGSFDFASGNANTARMPSLNISGNFSQTNAATFTTSTTDVDVVNGTISFSKSGVQTFSIVTQSHLTYTNFIVKSGSTLQLNSSLTLSSNNIENWGGNFTVSNGGSFNAATYQILSSSGSGENNKFMLSAGATIITSNPNGLQSGSTATVASAIASRSFNSAANYTFSGTTTQNSGIFTTTPVANQVNNLTLSNTGGGTGVTLQQTLAVAGTCYFSAGLITSSSTYMLIFNDNAIASGANNNTVNPSYVNGPVRKIGNDPFTFPVGKLGVGYMKCGISAPVSTSDAFTAEYKRNNASTLGSITAIGLARVSGCEYWTIDRTAGSSSVNVTLSWSGISPCNAAAYVTNLSYLVVAHFNGTHWNAYGNNGTTGNGAAGTVTWNSVSSFSPFTLGSTSSTTNPLPVKFSAIRAYRITEGNRIEWSNLTEEDLTRYEIERSPNGTLFHSILSITPKTNDGQKNDYVQTDMQPLDGINFYRVKAVQSDGSYSYSTIVKVETGSGQGRYISVYPNPVVAEQFTVQLNNHKKGVYTVKLLSGQGQMILTKRVKHPGGSLSVSFERPQSAAPGLYIVQVSGDGTNENEKLIMQ